MKNNIFHHIFHPPCFHPNHTQPKGIEQKYTIYLLKKKKKKKSLHVNLNKYVRLILWHIKIILSYAGVGTVLSLNCPTCKTYEKGLTYIYSYTKAMTFSFFWGLNKH